MVPTAAAPLYLLSLLTPAAAVSMVEKAVLSSLAKTRCIHSHTVAATTRACFIVSPSKGKQVPKKLFVRQDAVRSRPEGVN